MNVPVVHLLHLHFHFLFLSGAGRAIDRAFHPRTADRIQHTLRFLTQAARSIASMPAGCAHLSDQLRRAATSIALNIAEGAGETRAREKARFYRMARRSALECVAILDVAEIFGHAIDPTDSRQLLHEIVAMLSGLIAAWERQEVEVEEEKEKG